MASMLSVLQTCAAAAKNDLTVLEACVSVYPNVANEHCTFGGTALHYAIIFGRPEAVKVSLKYRADPSIRTLDGRTPLCLLLQYRDYFQDPVSVCKLLLEAGAGHTDLPDKVSAMFPQDYAKDSRLKEMERLIESKH